MHISRLQLVNYRNFARADALFNKGVNTIIGENSSGKTNLFRALRLLLDPDQMRWSYRLDETDFHRGLGNWRGHWIIISIEFSEVSQDEAIQALFLHGVGVVENGAVGRATYNLIFRPSAAIRSRLGELEEGDAAGLAGILTGLTVDDYETVMTGKSTADFHGSRGLQSACWRFRGRTVPLRTEPTRDRGLDPSGTLRLQGNLFHLRPSSPRRHQRVPGPADESAPDPTAQQERRDRCRRA